MTAEMLAEKAVEYKHNGHNCAQAVIRALAERDGGDADALVIVGAGFGGGMGTAEATCGALIGANIVAGMETHGQKTVVKAREMLKNFRELSGATICKELKGLETGTVLCGCDDCVRNAVLAALKVLDAE